MKMRETKHDMNIREYVIGSKGIEVKGRMKGVEGLVITSSKVRESVETEQPD
jgi:hypothetical protein